LEIKNVLAELKRERRKLDKVIAALEALRPSRAIRKGKATRGRPTVTSPPGQKSHQHETETKRQKHASKRAQVIAFPKMVGRAR
jgi:hypothetical protein